MNNEISFELKGLPELQRSIRNVTEKFQEEGGKVTLQAMRFFAVSAAKWTPPQPGRSFKGLGPKYKYRPIVKTPRKATIKNDFEYLYTRRKKNGAVVSFYSLKEISEATMRRDGITALVRTPYSFKAWSKKKRKFVLLNYHGAFTGGKGEKYDPSVRRGIIPAHGVVKLGWIHVLKAIGNGSSTEMQTPAWDKSKKGDFSFKEQKNNGNFFGVLNNEVNYASNIGRQVVMIAERAAAERLLGGWKKNTEKMKRSFNK